MNSYTITVQPVNDEHIPAVIDLLHAQDARQWNSDARLRAVRSHEQIAATLQREMREGQPRVALDAQKRVRGYVAPSVWAIKETSMLRAFLSARNGVTHTLALPDPADDDAQRVTSALLTDLNTFWKQQKTTGDLFRWPSSDTSWMEPLLKEHTFQLDSICAIYPHQPLTSPAHGVAQSSSLTTRLARPDDEEVLLQLLHEELAFHERYTPFVRSSSGVLDAFRRKLTRLWQGERLEQGAPLIIVAERDGEVVAMGENTLLMLEPDEEPGFTPPGRYACIDNVSVREDARGQGIGRMLTDAAFAAFASVPFEAYILWYNPDNVLAGKVWPHLGFRPLWTTYQRLHDGENEPLLSTDMHT